MHGLFGALRFGLTTGRGFKAAKLRTLELSRFGGLEVSKLRSFEPSSFRSFETSRLRHRGF